MRNMCNSEWCHKGLWSVYTFHGIVWSHLAFCSVALPKDFFNTTFLFLKVRTFSANVYECLAISVYVHLLCAWCPVTLEEGIISPGTEVMRSYRMGAKTKPKPYTLRTAYTLNHWASVHLPVLCLSIHLYMFTIQSTPASKLSLINDAEPG